jgi:cytochrome P450
MSMTKLADFDPFAPETVECPFRFHEALRKEAPAHLLTGAGYHLVSRYEDCRRAALDTETFSSNLVGVLLKDAATGPLFFELPPGAARPKDVLATADAPAHTRQRKLVNRAFSPRRVAELEPRVRELSAELTRACLDKGRVDFVAEFARPLPMTLICDLVGFRAADALLLQRYSDDGVALLSGTSSAEELAQHAGGVMELMVYLTACVKEHRERPPENVLGDLLRASQGQGDLLTEDEVVSILLQLIIAGQETTGSLLGSAVMLLCRDLSLQARLRQKPEEIPAFVEEALRVETPFHGHFRQATRDTEIGGVAIPKGSRVCLLWSSANRDESQFPSADEVDLERENGGTHLAFGLGTHHCIGAALARLEARVALETLLGLTREIRLAVDPVQLSHHPSLFARSLRELPLELS